MPWDRKYDCNPKASRMSDSVRNESNDGVTQLPCIRISDVFTFRESVFITSNKLVSQNEKLRPMKPAIKDTSSDQKGKWGFQEKLERREKATLGLN